MPWVPKCTEVACNHCGCNRWSLSSQICARFCFGVIYKKALFLYYHIATDNCDGSTANIFVYRFIAHHNFEDNMEGDTGTAKKTEPASPLVKNSTEDTCIDDSRSSGDGTCGTTDVARARWTLLRQVLLALKANTIPPCLMFDILYWIYVLQMCQMLHI